MRSTTGSLRAEPGAAPVWSRLTLSRLLVALTLIAVFGMALRAPVDTDMFWHLRAGEWQVEQRALLRSDVFSHTRAGAPWVNHSWLSQVILYGAHAALGDAGLALLTALLATLGMVFVYLQLEANAMLRAFVTVLAAAAAAIFWSARPQMFSFALSAGVLYLLWLWREKGVDRLWLIPVLMVLWVNLHGGFAIGFMLLVLALSAELVRWFFEDVLHAGADAAAGSSGAARRGLRPARRLVVIGLASAAAVAANPYGPQMLLYPFRTVGIDALRDYIQEWSSPNFHAAATWPFAWLLLGTPLAAALSPRRLSWHDTLLFGGMAYAALLASRNIAVFALVAAPILAAHLADWLAELGVRLHLDARPDRLRAVLNWALLLLALLAAAAWGAAELAPPRIAEAQRERLPVAATDFLVSERPPGPIFNSYNWGGYLAWEARDYPVYVDGRTDLYDDVFLREYLAIYLARDGWREGLREGGINTVLVEAGAPLAVALGGDAEWERAYADDLAVLYVRRQPIAHGGASG